MQFDDQAFQPYTAGSTGLPKGIVLTHGGMLWGIEHSELYWPRSPAERGIVAAPMFHKNAMRGNIKPILRSGGSVVIQRRFAPRPFLEALARYRVTTCGGVPAMFAEILQEAELIRSGDYSALKLISMGSSTVPEQLIARLHTAFPGVAVKESYGLTEGGGPTRAPLDGRPVPPGSVGIAAPEYEVKLVNAAGHESTEAGEMHIRSPYVLQAYAGLPDLTAARIYDGWLRTGDLFRADADGFYYFLGRSDDMFVCGGENMYPKDVEGRILLHPAVADAVVVPLPHQTKSFAPVAMVVLMPGASVDAQAIQDHCAAAGPAFAIPRAILVVERLPLTSTGKPDRRAIAAALAARFGTLSSRRSQARSDV
jgi:acyl-CoA synthetase (AMP-forming)/AMP-acid ligase II